MFEAATMQIMPKINWGQRDASAGTAPADVCAVDAIVVCPLIAVHFAVPTAIRSAYDSRPDSSREVSAHGRRRPLLRAPRMKSWPRRSCSQSPDNELPAGTGTTAATSVLPLLRVRHPASP